MGKTRTAALRGIGQELPAAEAAAAKRTQFLVLETQGELYAVRWALAKEAGVIFSSEISRSATQPHVERNGTIFPVCYLWQLVDQEKPKLQPAEIAAVFLEEGENRMMLVPDRILWKQETEVRTLPEWLRRAPVVAGVIALDSGIPVIVIEPFARLGSDAKT